MYTYFTYRNIISMEIESVCVSVHTQVTQLKKCRNIFQFNQRQLL